MAPNSRGEPLWNLPPVYGDVAAEVLHATRRNRRFPVGFVVFVVFNDEAVDRQGYPALVTGLYGQTLGRVVSDLHLVLGPV